MICPSCKADQDKVIDSRFDEATNTIRRRRECLVCGERMTSYEIITHVGSLSGRHHCPGKLALKQMVGAVAHA